MAVHDVVLCLQSLVSEKGGSAVPLDEVRGAIQESIKKLGFIPDLFLIHNPHVVAHHDLKKTWQILEEMKAAGELKEIGVSNFRPQDLELILDGAKYNPVVNQVRCFAIVCNKWLISYLGSNIIHTPSRISSPS